MSSDHDVPTTTQQAPFRLFPVGVVLALLVFFATYFTYVFRHQMHIPGSPIPLYIGTTTFFCLMAWLHYRAFSSQTALVRFAKTIGVAITETIVFQFLFYLLALNTLGS